MKTIDLSSATVRDLNQALHDQTKTLTEREWVVSNPGGKHNLAVGLNEALSVEIDGHAGYYCAGMNQKASVTIHGNVGVGVAENMMSGMVRIKGSASQAAGATAHGGLLVIEGDAGARCGISMKGVDIVVGGNIGHMSCFMGQAGRLVVCGDAGDALGDSLYETRIYVKGTVKSLGSDCMEKHMRPEHLEELAELLNRAGFDEDPASFKRYGSARQLYNFKVDNASAY
ncbi:protein glxC [Pseudomonas aeruginosa]|uniref:Protein glxC n=1 Tax=Ectopseudomonas oleovorans TaxID=301 RepID=A0A2T5PJD9_ECTOL|nr:MULTISPECIES: protein glxC [Pseudomonadota]MBH3592867.1 protein glxC [Pseudomonas aeruginosa]MBH3649688.1 protein glxC [Pseudomonas aeruginosa]MBH3696332.1 protein glxC [Pseudomonas aeruginosa]MBH3796276.1 protein glxC [Pseudomonas aeruginosa]MCE0755507.1 protein glxC [Pseudomonas asiatica]